jgi:hypothetical protein
MTPRAPTRPRKPKRWTLDSALNEAARCAMLNGEGAIRLAAWAIRRAHGAPAVHPLALRPVP